MKYLAFLLVLIPTLVFASDTLQNKLENDKYIKKYFSSDEIAELAKIISFVDSCVLQENKYREIDKAYHYYLDSLFVDDNNDIVTFDEDKRNDFLDSIDKTVFSEIWIKDSIGRCIYTKDTIYDYLEDFIRFDLRINGKYIQLIRELGDSSEYFKAAYEQSQIIGGLSPIAEVGLIYYNHQFDFNEVNVRLWAAILILMEEETMEKKLERYFGK